MNAPAPKLPDPTGGTPAPQPTAGSPPVPPNKEPAAPAAGATPPVPGATPPAGTPPADAKPKGSSIYQDVGLEEPGKEGTTVWPTDWREQLAAGAGDPKAAKLLERFQSPADVAKALIAAQQKIRSGEYKRAAPPSDNPEELKAWREEQGIPESPDGYEIPGVDLATLDPATKDTLEFMRGKLHEAAFDKGKAGVVAQLLQDVAVREIERTAQADATNRDAVEDALRAEWGAEYRRNINMNGAFLNQHFGDGMEAVLNARAPDGRRLADMPEFNKFLNAMARANGSDVMFDGDVKGGASIETRLEEIRRIMATNINEYYAKGLDKEYSQLLEKQEARARR